MTIDYSIHYPNDAPHPGDSLEPLARSTISPGQAGWIISPSMASEANAHTIQAFVENVYVRTGNEVLTAGLADLESALSVTSDALDSLGTLQQLHNQVVVQSKPNPSDYPDGFKFGSDYGGVPTDYVSAYEEFGSEYYGVPIFPEFGWSSDGDATVIGGYNGFSDFQRQLNTTFSNLRQVLTDLSDQTTFNSGFPDPNSLYAKIQAVLNDVPSTWGLSDDNPSNVTFNAASLWALDSYTINDGKDTVDLQDPFYGSDNSRSDASKAGSYQQNITFAITAAQSLNDTQKEKVRRYMFVFEEYYKSASAILSKLTQ
ncbi:MAG: hypothetical protein KDK72_05785, partial [Chlamydiia bacterium]|nr:hypothetical protein [Chlamydiia bacterium]